MCHINGSLTIDLIIAFLGEFLNGLGYGRYEIIW